MAKAKTFRAAPLRVEALETREMPSTSPLSRVGLLSRETFQSTALSALPNSWTQWTNDGPVAVSAEQALTGTTGLAASGVTGQTARAWANQRFSTDLKASVAVYVDSLIPAQLIIRGSSLDTANPSF